MLQFFLQLFNINLRQTCIAFIYDGDKDVRTALICEATTWIWGLVFLQQAGILILATMRSIPAFLSLVALVAAGHGPYHNYKVSLLF